MTATLSAVTDDQPVPFTLTNLLPVPPRFTAVIDTLYARVEAAQHDLDVAHARHRSYREQGGQHAATIAEHREVRRRLRARVQEARGALDAVLALAGGEVSR